MTKRNVNQVNKKFVRLIYLNIMCEIHSEFVKTAEKLVTLLSLGFNDMTEFNFYYTP